MRQSSPAPPRLLAAEALAALDDALGQAPNKDGPKLTQASQRLAVLRDALIERERRSGGSAGSSAELETVNGVISLALAAHFPLGPIPWPSVRQGREALARLADTL